MVQMKKKILTNMKDGMKPEESLKRKSFYIQFPNLKISCLAIV